MGGGRKCFYQMNEIIYYLFFRLDFHISFNTLSVFLKWNSFDKRCN